MNKLFNYFDKIFLINLDSRKDRLDESMKILNTYNLGEKLIRFSAITPPPNLKDSFDEKGRKISRGAVGLILSMLEIFKESKKNNYNSILILEDDFLLKNEEYGGDVIEQLKNIEWDVFYLGANLHQKLDNVSNNLYKIKYGYATHAVAYNKNFYDYFLTSYDSGDIKILDVWLSEFAQNNLNCFCSWPILSIQRPSYSDIENKFTDYDWMINNYNKNTKDI